MINRLRSETSIKNFEIANILKVVSNKKTLPPINKLRNADTLFQLCEKYFIEGPKKTDTAEGYLSGYFMEIQDLLHVFNCFSRNQRKVSNEFAHLIQTRIDQVVANGILSTLNDQESFRLVLCVIRYGNQMAITTVNNFLKAYINMQKTAIGDGV